MAFCLVLLFNGRTLIGWLCWHRRICRIWSPALTVEVRCELRALSPTTVPFLLLVPRLKGEGGRWRGRLWLPVCWVVVSPGQHHENSAGSGSSLRISLVSSQLPHRNKARAVENLLNNYSQYVRVLP